MPQKRDEQPSEKRRKRMNIALAVVMLLILGSCANDISSVGGGYDRNKKMAYTFFGYLAVFLVFVATFIYIDYRHSKKSYSITKTKPPNEQSPNESTFGQSQNRSRFGQSPEVPRWSLGRITEKLPANLRKLIFFKPKKKN